MSGHHGSGLRLALKVPALNSTTNRWQYMVPVLKLTCFGAIDIEDAELIGQSRLQCQAAPRG
jgi:hypothetical protein